MSAIDDKRKAGNQPNQKLVRLHTLWYEMNLIEQIEWLDKAKRTPQNRARNWILHIINLTLVISTIFILLMPQEHSYNYILAITAGYITSLNITAMIYIGSKLKHR